MSERLAAYPESFAAKVVELTEEVRKWVLQRAKVDPLAWKQLRRADEKLEAMVEAGVLDADCCKLIHDLALSAGGVVMSAVLKQRDFKDDQDEFERLIGRTPAAVDRKLWLRTWQLLLANAGAACAAIQGDAEEEARQLRVFEQRSCQIAGRAPSADEEAPEVPAHIVMFSGCKDHQTSADVYDTVEFGLLPDTTPGGAGGALTNALLGALGQADDYTWTSLLSTMRKTLKEGGYDQIPELSSSRRLDLQGHFSIKHAASKKCKALLCGLNYPGSDCELSGCHNDVDAMKRFLLHRGFKEDDMRIQLDDGNEGSVNPTRDNMIEGMKWLVEGAEEEDSLFFHYSGHGTHVLDIDGDEDDGQDEALCPNDCDDVGFINDDEIYKLLVEPLKAGVYLTCVLDCCHSGTVLDLPFVFKAEGEDCSELEKSMRRNVKFRTSPSKYRGRGKAVLRKR